MSLAKKSKNGFKSLLFVFLLILMATGLVGVNYYKQSIGPHTFDGEYKNITIEKGTTWNQAFEKLEANDVIESASIAKVYSKMNTIGELKAGNYQIPNGFNLEEVISYLTGNNAIINQVMITIPEGYWAKQIALILEENLGIQADDFLNAWNDKEYIKELIKDYEVLTEDIINDDSKVYLEGYLFPETYYFKTETNVDEVTRRILDHTQKIYDTYKEQFHASNFSIHEIFTFASILQFESGSKDEMATIASVFYNRLNKDMMLQSSVTVCYAIYDYSDWKACEYYAEVDSPYNTYKVKGLPPSPIENPGEEAIKATLYPEKTDYYFFIGDVHGSGKTIFAKTYAEHLKNIDKYLK